MIYRYTPILPEDAPLNETGRKRYSDYRLDPIIDALCNRLRSWLNTHDQNRSIPPRIGMFGGLGQGKSTVIRCVLNKMDDDRSKWQKIRSWIFGPRIAQFDVSFFKANDLEWRFLTAVLWRRIIRNLLPVVLLLTIELFILVALLICYLRWRLPECPVGWYLGLCWLLDVLLSPWTGLLALFSILLPKVKRFSKSVGKAKAHNPAKDLYLSARDLMVQKIAGFMLALPDIVVIDDLDRATVEQQRAFLRAISRFSREMGFAVVICIDESELLAAPPNPESPEELLRKTLNAELRIPDRTREDVVLLVISCVREFSRDNPPSSGFFLLPALQSVQFVADLTRVLLLGQTPSSVSPRMVRRLFARVVLHASQLKITAVDDLAALMRLDGLLQLAPALRRYMDGLRHVLESNRLPALHKLLADAKVSVEQHQTLEHFFNRTRMLQPSMSDGWFRLLGGLEMTDNDFTVSAQKSAPWSASWNISPQGHTFYRHYLEGIELDAAGYEHNLSLSLETLPGGNERYCFYSLLGGEIHLAVGDLPSSLREGETNDYFSQCWVLWVCALALAKPGQKHTLLERAYRWIGGETNDKVSIKDLFWRECLADSDLWEGEGDSSRSIHKIWWERARNAISLPVIERFFAHQLVSDSFTDAWSVLVRPGTEVRDGRKALYWWAGVTPKIDANRMQKTDEINLVSRIWPAPEPETQDAIGWIKVLTQHIQALNALNSVKGQLHLDPSPLLYSWQRAQPLLDVGQCLDILYSLACDDQAPSGFRWSIHAVERWLVDLNMIHECDLKAVVESPKAEYGELRSTQRRLTLVLLAGLRNWTPGDVVSLVYGLPKKELQEIHSILSNRGISTQAFETTMKNELIDAVMENDDGLALLPNETSFADEVTSTILNEIYLAK